MLQVIEGTAISFEGWSKEAIKEAQDEMNFCNNYKDLLHSMDKLNIKKSELVLDLETYTELSKFKIKTHPLSSPPSLEEYIERGFVDVMFGDKNMVTFKLKKNE